VIKVAEADHSDIITGRFSGRQFADRLTRGMHCQKATGGNRFPHFEVAVLHKFADSVLEILP